MSNTRQDSGWSSELYKRFKIPMSDQPPAMRSNPSLSRHPLGKVWRSALAHYVFTDLSAGLRSGRRFVRLEYPGLHAIILYEYPPVPDDSSTQGTEGSKNGLTLQQVFGDDADPDDLGMEVDELIDLITARLIYVPSYACTSFAIGQLMHASVLRTHLCPRATCHGFVIDHSMALPVTLTSSDTNAAEFLAASNASAVGASSGLDSVEFLGENERGTLPVRKNESGTDDYEDMKAMDTSMSTQDSLGPHTPPQTNSENAILLPPAQPSTTCLLEKPNSDWPPPCPADACAIKQPGVLSDSTNITVLDSPLALSTFLMMDPPGEPSAKVDEVYSENSSAVSLETCMIC